MSGGSVAKGLCGACWRLNGPALEEEGAPPMVEEEAACA